MMWVIVVQHDEDNHVTRVLGQYGAHELALSCVDQFRKDHRGFVFSVHPVHPFLPKGGTPEADEAS